MRKSTRGAIGPKPLRHRTRKQAEFQDIRPAGDRTVRQYHRLFRGASARYPVGLDTDPLINSSSVVLGSRQNACRNAGVIIDQNPQIRRRGEGGAKHEAAAE